MVQEGRGRNRARDARRRAAGSPIKNAARTAIASTSACSYSPSAIASRSSCGSSRSCRARSARAGSTSRSARSTCSCSALYARFASSSASAMKESPMAPKDNHDDFLTGTVPEPDAEPTAAERAHAKTFAELVDKTLAGKAPAAMSADDSRAARGRHGDPCGGGQRPSSVRASAARSSKMRCARRSARRRRRRAAHTV